MIINNEEITEVMADENTNNNYKTLDSIRKEGNTVIFTTDNGNTKDKSEVFHHMLYSDTVSKRNSSSSVIAPISIAFSNALNPPASFIDGRAPLIIK